MASPRRAPSSAPDVHSEPKTDTPQHPLTVVTGVHTHDTVTGVTMTGTSAPPLPTGWLPAEFVQGRVPWHRLLVNENDSSDFAFAFDVARPIDELYPLLRDSALINRRLRFPKFKTRERGGVTEAEWRVLGIPLAQWIEDAFEWQERVYLQSMRSFSSRILRHLRVRFVLEPGGENRSETERRQPTPRSRVWIAIGFVPRREIFRRLGVLVTRLTAAWMRYRMRGWMLTATSEHDRRTDLPVTTPQVSTRSTPGESDDILALRFESFLKRTGDEDLQRLRPKVIAQAIGASVRETTNLLLARTREGDLLLTWDLICPHCRGSRRSTPTLGDLPEREVCEPCGIEFETSAPYAVEVTFRLHPQFRRVDERVFCSAGALAKPHIFLQQWVETAQQCEWDLRLAEGTYRGRFQRGKGYTVIDVREGNPTVAAWNGLANDGLRLAPSARLQVYNPNEPAHFILEQTEDDHWAMRPAELFNFPQFRDLFPHAAIASGVSLEIGEQTLLLTDIVGSTKLYETLDNIDAFAHVREHFVRVFDRVQTHGGAVVKTIGDAALTVFPDALSAVRCAFALQEAFPPTSRLRLRVIVNRGNCVAVNLNTGVDYFGKTVNRTAKMEKLAGAGEIVMSQELADLPQLREMLAPWAKEAGTVVFDGNPESFRYAKIKVFK